MNTASPSAAARRVVRTPTVSFSTLARLMGPATPRVQASLLRNHKFPTDGPKRSYQKAREQLIAHLTRGTPFEPRAQLREHEREVVRMLQRTGVRLPRGVACARPSSAPRHWNFEGVNISVFPDVDVFASDVQGALKAYFGKEKLERGVGAAMSGLLLHYKANILEQAGVSGRHCLVYEVRTDTIHRATNGRQLLSTVRAACKLITALWPTL